MAVLFFFCTNLLAAQQVLYSSYLNDRNAERFEITGKSGEYYWVQKNKKKSQIELPAMPWRSDKQPTFEIFDSRLNEIATVTGSAITDTTMKEYFIPSEKYFDHLILLKGSDKTYISLDRYAPDGEIIGTDRILDTLFFTEHGNSFILLRSEDKSKVLLLCFQTIPDEPLQLHGILFDENWNKLSINQYRHRYITQPFVQYEFFNYPVEHFSTSSIKLGNNGDWIMVAPSGRNHNFSLFHFNGTDTAFVYKDIQLPASSSVEEVALSIDNEKQEAMAGILSKFRYSTLKNAEVANYSMQQKKITFDSSFRFNTLLSGRIRNENLYEESFVTVPKMGFMLLKEYGKEHPGLNRDIDETTHPAGSVNDIMIDNGISGNDTPSPVMRNEYTRYNTLAGPRSNYSRGDLSLFYFPANKEDSSWSGIINKEQVTELNSSYLSYLIVPVAGKLFFLYNSFLRSNSQYGTTTVLNFRGEELDEAGIVYSKINNSLLFQKARQIAENEIAVPYKNSERNGFAIIKF